MFTSVWYLLLHFFIMISACRIRSLILLDKGLTFFQLIFLVVTDAGTHSICLHALVTSAKTHGIHIHKHTHWVIHHDFWSLKKRTSSNQSLTQKRGRLIRFPPITQTNQQGCPCCHVPLCRGFESGFASRIIGTSLITLATVTYASLLFVNIRLFILSMHTISVHISQSFLFQPTNFLLDNEVAADSHKSTLKNSPFITYEI